MRAAKSADRTLRWPCTSHCPAPRWWLALAVRIPKIHRGLEFERRVVVTDHSCDNPPKVSNLKGFSISFLRCRSAQHGGDHWTKGLSLAPEVWYKLGTKRMRSSTGITFPRESRRMGGVVPRLDERGASPEQLNLLLERLDPNRDRAGEIYEALRRKLMKYFVWNNCYPSDDLADETLDRVAKKLKEVEDVGQFAFGVARMIRLEAYDRMKRMQQPPEDSCSDNDPSPVEEFSETAMVNKIDMEKRRACLAKCFSRLSVEERGWVQEYYGAEERSEADHRQKMAEKLGLSAGALRTRMNRLRDRLEECIKVCIGMGTRGAARTRLVEGAKPV